MSPEFTTDRLRLRLWTSADRELLAAMMGNPEVADWLGGTQSREAVFAAVERFGAELETTGLGWWALERREDGAFLGAVELRAIRADLPLPAGHEIGWRLTRSAWGFGYATEAAGALLRHGFETLALAEIVAFTARSNLRSRAVMQRLEMRHDPARDFDHPALAEDHPLRPHVVYVATAA